MNCEEKKTAFQEALAPIQTQLQASIASTAADAENKAKELSKAADGDNNLAEGVGMAAGTVVGGYFGGPAGAVVGATIGKQIGQLFEIEITNQEVSLKFDLPEVTLKDQDFSLDLPFITIKDSDIGFTIIETVMVDKKVGQYPETTCSSPSWDDLIPHCTITWHDIIASVPELRPKDIKIIVGMPEVVMKTQHMVMGVPEFRMVTNEVKFNIPSITIRSKKDIAKDLTAKAQTLADESAKNIEEKKTIAKTQIQMEVNPKATDMFACFRDTILTQRGTVTNVFDPTIVMLSDTLKNLVARGLPTDDGDYIKVSQQMESLTKQREDALKGFDDALVKLDADAKLSLESLINF